MAKLKKETRYVIVFPEGHGRFAVESWSRPDQFQTVDLQDMTCSCERFTIDPKDKGKPCRHMKDLAKLHQAGRLAAFL